MDDIFTAGDNLMKSLYNCTKVDLDEQRYLVYCQKLGAGNTSKEKKKVINLATFPPTSGSTKQHSLRTYYQVQVWRGEMKDPSMYRRISQSDPIHPRSCSSYPDECSEMCMQNRV